MDSFEDIHLHRDRYDKSVALHEESAELLICVSLPSMASEFQVIVIVLAILQCNNLSISLSPHPGVVGLLCPPVDPQ